MGFCALCGVSAELQSSHYLAAAFFRRLHGSDAGRVTPPILLNPHLMMYNCRQPQAKLLCQDCEHRFKVNGEDWVIDCTARTDRSFPLRDLLLSHAPLSRVGPTKEGRVAYTFSGVQVPAIQKDKLLYFAASVFWRGAVFDWSRVSDHAQLSFPPGLGQELQTFLMGSAPFPSSVILQVEVAIDPTLGGGEIGMVFPEPIQPRQAGPPEPVRGYFFSIFGITFLLFFDGSAAGMKTKYASVAEPPHFLSLTNVRMEEVTEQHGEMKTRAKPVGLLAKRHRL
jgi:hypothetical protein